MYRGGEEEMSADYKLPCGCYMKTTEAGIDEARCAEHAKEELQWMLAYECGYQRGAQEALQQVADEAKRWADNAYSWMEGAGMPEFARYEGMHVAMTKFEKAVRHMAKEKRSGTEA